MSLLGHFVKLRREELSLDQAALARQLGVNQQTVSKWERAITVPRPDRVRRLAEVLRVEVSELMRYAGYLPDGEPADGESGEPFARLLDQVSGLTNEQLILLIDQAWKEFRSRSISDPKPRRSGGESAGG